jgi:hypothetical protein
MIGEPLVEVRDSLRTLHIQEKVSFKGSPACLPACPFILCSSHGHLLAHAPHFKKQQFYSFQWKTNRSEDMTLMSVTISDFKTKNLKNLNKHLHIAINKLVLQ